MALSTHVPNNVHSSYIHMSGGLLAQSKPSWRAIFWLQTALGCGLCGMGWFVLPPDVPNRRYNKGLDWVGAILSTSGLRLLVYDLGFGFSFYSHYSPQLPTYYSQTINERPSRVGHAVRSVPFGHFDPSHNFVCVLGYPS